MQKIFSLDLGGKAFIFGGNVLTNHTLQITSFAFEPHACCQLITGISGFGGLNFLISLLLSLKEENSSLGK